MGLYFLRSIKSFLLPNKWKKRFFCIIKKKKKTEKQFFLKSFYIEKNTFWIK
jgi:hypothetical protein